MDFVVIASPLRFRVMDTVAGLGLGDVYRPDETRTPERNKP